MKQFITFVRKEFLHIFRDSRTMLILLGMPMVQMLLFGFAITTEVRNTKVAVFDPSQSMETRAIKERFDASEYFTIVEEIRDVSRINDVFKYGEIGLVMVFSDDFESELHQGGDAAVQLITDGTEPNQASMITGYASNILALSMQELSEGSSAPCRIIPEIRMLYNPQAESAYNFVRSNGNDTYAYLCHDDLNSHCARKGKRHYGDTACIAHETYIHHPFQGYSVFYTVYGKSCNHTSAFGLCTRSTYCRESVSAAFRIGDIHLPCIVARTAYLECGEHTGGSHACVRNGTNDARHASFRSDIPRRKYATSATVSFCPCSRKVVC